MIEDQKRFKAYQNEIETILNHSYDHIKKNMTLTTSEIELAKEYFGYEYRYLEIEKWNWRSCYPELYLLMRLMYGDNEGARVDHYLMKAQRVINIAIHKAYGIKGNE